ncbi:MAG: diguanylate cyclase [Spirochaetes bacterium]|nr:MAG: diguanylate cyclase [Spirochaetota bacterium]
MSFQGAELFYLLNLVFVVAYSTAMFMYLGRHDMRASGARSLQQVLVGIISWAFYDSIMARMGRLADPETAFLLFRVLSFMWLAFGGLASEQIISLIRPVGWRLRTLIYLPYFLMYLSHIAFPNYTSAAVYGIPGGWDSYPGPWQMVYNSLWMGMFLFLAGWLAVSVRRERDPNARSEKTVLLAGVVLAMGGLGLSRFLLQKMGPGFPALGNVSMALYALAAFVALKKYGRVISHRTIYRTTVNSIPNGLAHVHEGLVTWTNTAFLEMLGKSEAQTVGRPIRNLLNDAGMQADGAGEEESGARELPRDAVLHRGDSYLMVSSTPLDPDDPEQGTLFVLTDITDREKAAVAREHFIRELERLSSMDGLTRVYNRRFFDGRLEEEWFRLQRSGRPLSLLMLDIDHFKNYNDAYGHQAGDECLREIARIIRQNCKRASDIPARYGGEEFAVIMPETEAEGARAAADAIRREVQESGIVHAASPVAGMVTISIGAATVFPTKEFEPGSIVALADDALFKSKRAGRNRVTVRETAGSPSPGE